jgi:hypothetical protein
MSAIPSDDLTFRIRAARDQLGSDMAAARAQVVSETKKITEAAKAVVASDPIRPRFAIDESTVRTQFANVLRALKAQAQAEVIQVQVFARIRNIGDSSPNAANIDARERFRGTEAAAREAAERGAGRGVDRPIAESVGRFARGVLVVTAAAEASGLFFQSASAWVAKFNGDSEKFGRLIDQAAEQARSLPLIGGAVKQFENFLGFISGISADIAKAAADAAEIDKNTARMAAKAKKQLDAIADLKQTVGSVGADPSVTMQSEAAFQVERARQRKELEDKLRAAPEAERDPMRAEAERRFAAEDFQRTTAREDRERELGVQAEAARLRSIGDLRAADELEFEADLRASRAACLRPRARIRQATECSPAGRAQAESRAGGRRPPHGRCRTAGRLLPPA